MTAPRDDIGDINELAPFYGLVIECDSFYGQLTTMEAGASGPIRAARKRRLAKETTA